MEYREQRQQENLILIFCYIYISVELPSFSDLTFLKRVQWIRVALIERDDRRERVEIQKQNSSPE